MPAVRNIPLPASQNLIESVVNYLLPSGMDVEGVLLDSTIIVVPTQQTGRRLRHALVSAASRLGCGIGGLSITTLARLFAQTSSQVVASPATVRLAWVDALLQVPLDSLPALYRGQLPAQDRAWALRTGDVLQALRVELADVGLDISAVYREHGDAVQELERWRDLVSLEQAYRAELARHQLLDPCDSLIERLKSPALGTVSGRLVLAGVCDPPPIYLSALERLYQLDEIEILIPGATDWPGAFDRWGRPVPDYWTGRQVDLAIDLDHLILAQDPAGQAAETLRIIERHADAYKPGDVTIGVPDPDVIPALQEVLTSHGLKAHDPSGMALREHRLYHLVKLLLEFLDDASFDTLSRLLHHPDLLAWAVRDSQADEAEVLSRLDVLRRDHLPVSLEHVQWALAALLANKENHYRGLSVVVNRLADQRDRLLAGPLVGGLRTLLDDLLKEQVVDPEVPGDAIAIQAAGALADAFAELEAMPATEDLPAVVMADLLMAALDGKALYGEAEPAHMELAGWLELAWDPAPVLIVTGMNEGRVPPAVPVDPFLTESLRQQLGLRNDESRLSRDTYQLYLMLEQRRAAGEVYLLSGRYSPDGDPLSPARPILQGEDEVLLDRLGRLLRESPSPPPAPPPNSGLQLDPWTVAETDGKKAELSVTRFRDYLRCPFRYYLKHVLRMQALDEKKVEWDALDFGIIAHEAMCDLGKDPAMAACNDKDRVGNFLCDSARTYVRKVYGEPRSLILRAQLEALCLRLHAAAGAQVQLVEEGWRIHDQEFRLQAQIDGYTITAVIDRLDYHPVRREWRVLDYKTYSEVKHSLCAEHSVEPATIPAHFRDYQLYQGRYWKELQLPLYAWLLLANDRTDGELAMPGYFFLPDDPDATDLVQCWQTHGNKKRSSKSTPWDNFDADLCDSALCCARGVVADVAAGRHWPPAETCTYDDYEVILAGTPVAPVVAANAGDSGS